MAYVLETHLLLSHYHCTTSIDGISAYFIDVASWNASMTFLLYQVTWCIISFNSNPNDITGLCNAGLPSFYLSGYIISNELFKLYYDEIDLFNVVTWQRMFVWCQIVMWLSWYWICLDQLRNLHYVTVYVWGCIYSIEPLTAHLMLIRISFL